MFDLENGNNMNKINNIKIIFSIFQLMTEEKLFDSYNVIEYEKSNIYIIENIFSHELCYKLIDIINKTSNTKTEYHRSNNVLCFQSSLNELLTSNDEFYYKFSTDVNEYNKLLDNVGYKKDITTNDMKGITKKQIKDVFIEVNEKMNIISKIMKSRNNHLNLEYNHDYNLRKIFGATRNHTDGITEIYHSNIMSINENHLREYRMVRNATIIFALNDDYVGGIFNFKNQDISFKLNKGSVLIFPPYWTHPHEVSDLQNNTYRYTLSTWSCQQI